MGIYSNLLKRDGKAQRLKVGDEFIGWSKLEDASKSLENDRYELLILTAFKTGGRITEEVLPLTLANFDFEQTPNSVVVKDMALSKRFKIISKGNTQKIYAIRDTFPVIYKEPLTNRWIELLKQYGSRKRLLFPSWNRKLPISRVQAHNIISKAGEAIGIRLGPHYLRGQRASQLEDEYDFTDRYLNRFFGWAEDKSKESRRYPKPSCRKLERLMLRGLQRLREDDNIELD